MSCTVLFWLWAGAGDDAAGDEELPKISARRSWLFCATAGTLPFATGAPPGMSSPSKSPCQMRTLKPICSRHFSLTHILAWLDRANRLVLTDHTHHSCLKLWRRHALQNTRPHVQIEETGELDRALLDLKFWACREREQ